MNGPVDSAKHERCQNALQREQAVSGFRGCDLIFLGGIFVNIGKGDNISVDKGVGFVFDLSFEIL